MRIAEISSPDHRLNSDNHHDRLLPHIDNLIKQAENHNLSPEKLSTLSSDLRDTFTRLNQLAPLSSNSVKLQIWKLSYRLWNSCVDLSNSALASRSSSVSFVETVATLRHVAADLLYLAIDVSGVPSPAIKTTSFYHKTGLVWHDLKKFNLACTCFERATEIVSKLDVTKIYDSVERKLLLDVNLARSRTAWEVLDRNLATTLLNRAKKSLLYGSFEHYKAVANQYLVFAKSVLSKSNNNESSSFNEALKLMNETLDVCEKGLNEGRVGEGAKELKELHSKTLRFISAVHLQKGEYESVIKCVKVLREGGGDHHASLPVLAMKAWLGLGRYVEAEKELRGMVAIKGIPEGVWVSAVEAFFQASGTAAGAETAKGVFMGLLGRCHVSAKAAVRVAHRVVGDGEDVNEVAAKLRSKVAADLVSDERVQTLFTGEAVAKERRAMHTVLWNW